MGSVCVVIDCVGMSASPVMYLAKEYRGIGPKAVQFDTRKTLTMRHIEVLQASTAVTVVD